MPSLFPPPPLHWEIRTVDKAMGPDDFHGMSLPSPPPDDQKLHVALTLAPTDTHTPFSSRQRAQLTTGPLRFLALVRPSVTTYAPTDGYRPADMTLLVSPASDVSRSSIASPRQCFGRHRTTSARTTDKRNVHVHATTRRPCTPPHARLPLLFAVITSAPLPTLHPLVQRARP